MTRFIDAARDHEAQSALGIEYALDDAERLTTIRDSTVDVASAVLVLHHVSDLSAAFQQIRRVLRPGGRLVAVVPHPWSDHPEMSWARVEGDMRRTIGHYAHEGYWTEGDASPGAEITTIRQIGWFHYTIATWFTGLATAGFCLERVVEPQGGASGRSDAGGPWRETPRFLGFSAIRR